ncbi:iron complex outermembrane recepter protein [Mariniphaga anaerophila]|uniref:Iron complex outermembrane recepter protein n=1 Tax=Mariniphaga anaerophila TaxID=1484053 RepID=A0A1M4WTU1_9BACT|nr:TonB-dependent receptor [Mariniphaga anaerophila]SHE84577.1 iron complex outermembrane recepter protein [Mariniphaga anaerophila]
MKIKFLFTTAFVICIAYFALSGTPVKGTITDTDDISIVSATVLIKGTQNYAVTDLKGRFQLETEMNFPIFLQIRSVGMIPREVKIAAPTDEPVKIVLLSDNTVEEIIVTARRRAESLAEIPVPISVILGTQADNAHAFNVNRVKELIPSVQLYSSNPRNTTLNIRGLGSTFGLTNDGIDPGVGFYVDGVYYARPAATTLDFIDVERIEVLRGPQGTLYGKNTTAGAFNITTRKPEFTPTGKFEVSYGNYGFIQAKASLSGPLGKSVAARLSFSGTQRDGTIYNVARQEHVNDLNNLGVRGQLLIKPSSVTEITFAADVTRQRPNGYAMVFAGVAPTLRPEYRQFEQIIADLKYELPSRNPFDRLIDHDTPWRSKQDFGGASVNVNIETTDGMLTSTSAWRYWNWGPSNDRDFTGLQALTLSQAPSKHQQWSQEIRYAGDFSRKLSGVAGVFAIYQKLAPDGTHTQESGKDQWRFSQNSESALWQTPGLLEGYGLKTYPNLETFSGALFSQIDWAITRKIHLLPGLRINFDHKKIDFRRETYGGLQTDDPELIALKNSVYNEQAFNANINKTNISGQLTVNFKANKKLNTFATVATNFKPVGLNLGGLPRQNGEAMTDLAVIKPEKVIHYEAGLKSSPFASSFLNFTVFSTSIKDYQTQVQAADLSVNRGYLANAEKVRVAGAELDSKFRINSLISINAAAAYTDGKYVSFKNAPPPLEETGGPSFKDVSGQELPGISKWAFSGGIDFSKKGTFFSRDGNYFMGTELFYRSKFSSSSSPSKYLVINSYSLINAQAGFRDFHGLTVYIWVRNLANTNYFEQLLPAGGNAGHYAAVLGDPLTVGLTLRKSFKLE